MEVSIRFLLTSTAVIHEDVMNTYQKGSLFCLNFGSGKVLKYPIENIFDIVEIEG